MESREDKSLFQNHVFTFKISRFTIFRSLLTILRFFIKIINFLPKIGPLWAHKGPVGIPRKLELSFGEGCMLGRSKADEYKREDSNYVSGID